MTLPKPLNASCAIRKIPPALATVMQSALREYLAMEGHPQPGGPLRITPAKRGSGLHDVSVDHDRYLTER